jgi:HEAT repeat protein
MRQLLWLGAVLISASACQGAIDEQKPVTVPDLIQQLSHNDFHVRQRAAKQLGDLGLAARDAVPALARLLHDVYPDVRNSAAKALAQIGPPAVPHLVQTLKDRDAGIRARAAQALGQGGPDVKGAMPPLIEALMDKHVDVRVAAVDALGEMGVEGSEAAPNLAQLFHDPSLRVREHVRVALSSIGPAAVDPLCDVLGAERADVRLDAIKTIALFGRYGKKAVPALRQSLKDEDHRIRAAAAETLGLMRAEGADAVPELLASLRDKKQLVHDKAADTLVLMTMDGVPDLLEKVRAAERKGQWVVPNQIVAAAANPLTPFIKDLSDKETQVRVRAALTLGSMGANAQAAIPSLARLLTDENAQVRFSAAMAIAHIQRNKAEHQVVVKRMLRDIQDQVEDLEIRLTTGVRPGTVNPLFQSRLRDLVMTYITVKASSRLQFETPWLDKAIRKLGVEAVPALVEGVNYISTFRLGDC